MSSIKDFVKQWTGRGYEKGEMQPFWLSFLRDVLNVSKLEKFICFEVPVKLKHASFIDAFLSDTKVIIEQKSLSEDLTQGKSQLDSSTLTPYEQAQRYRNSLPYSMRPRWIVVCNFAQFLIYDMEALAAPTQILLSELPKNFTLLISSLTRRKTNCALNWSCHQKPLKLSANFMTFCAGSTLNPTTWNNIAQYYRDWYNFHQKFYYT